MGSTAVTDLAGNALNSSLIGGIAGSDFQLIIARGRTLTYNDENGTKVTLTLKGPGVLDLNQAVSGLVERIQVVGVTKASTLSGTVAKGHRTTIGSFVGLQQFGTVLTHLYSPPFFVTNTIYPNLQSLNNGIASDTLIGASTTTTTKSKGKTVKAKSVTISAHPHAAAAHSLHATHKVTR